MINLIDMLKSLPMNNYRDIGLAISYSDIFNALESIGFDNKDKLNYELKKLSDNGVIELFCMNDFDKDLIYAVRFK